LEDAEKQADRILGIDQACAPAWNLKGLIANKKGDDDAAEGYFVQAIELDPSYGAPYTNRGMLQWTSDHKEEALDLLEKGFILSSLSTDSVTLYHSAITALEQFERAEKIFRDAKELHPENKRILFFLIDMLINQGKFEKAMREVERAMPDIGIDDGMLPAALALRDKVGIKEIDKALKSKGTLSLCMIVKNEEKHLARCLLNAGPAADEMIVVDTGSTDRTMDIARAYGARVFDFEWTHDFSEARNHSLENASGDWILVLDADEVISPQDYSEFEKIMKNRPSRPVAYTMITRNYTYEVTAKGWTANDRKYLREEAGTGWFPSAKVRLFVNDKRIRFQNPVHEFVEASLEKARIEIKISSIPVHHYGRFDKDKIIEKGKKYFLLGKKKIEEMKGDIKALKELAIQATELGEYDTSVELWKEAIKLDQGHADVFFNMGYAYLKLNKYQEALDASRRATELDPSLKEAAINYAGGEFLIGDIKKAISIVEALLQKHPDYPPATLLLATAYYVQDQKEKGLGLFEKLRKRGFNWTDFLDEQSRALISLERLDQAMLLLEAAVKTGNINKDTDSLLAELQSRIR
jgi:glycosyltransferase involved in cell wall biosynthesis